MVTSAVGLLYPDIYADATVNWKLQTIGQDGVDFFLIVPVLAISGFYAAREKRFALLVWGGTNIYIVYTFIIYCFDVRFNSLFVPYCLILGLGFYSSAIFVYKLIKDDYTVQVTSVARKLIGYFFIVLSVVFYFVWLSDILPATFHGEVPAAVAETGLPTNPVHVIDLAIVLPLMFVVGIFMLRGNSLAISMATPLLTFTILMDITIAVLAWLLFRRGVSDSYPVTVIMGSHAALSLAATLILYKPVISKV